MKPYVIDGPVPVEPEYPSPQYAQIIQFKGCPSVIISLETYEEITAYIDSLQSALQVAQQERDRKERMSQGNFELYKRTIESLDKAEERNKQLVELLKALLGALKHPVPPSQKQWDAIGVVSDNILREVGK